MLDRLRVTALALIGVGLGSMGLQARADDNPIEPDVQTREVHVPHIPARDLELGYFQGTFSAQNYGARPVRGVRLGLALTEDVFVQGSYGETKVSDANYRALLPAGLFAQVEEKLTYYNFSLGLNLFPGETFFFSRYARPSAFYVVAGVGNARYTERTRQAIHYGAGFRLQLCSWFAVQADARSHNFTMDVLGHQMSTRNLEFTGGAAIVF